MITYIQVIPPKKAALTSCKMEKKSKVIRLVYDGSSGVANGTEIFAKSSGESIFISSSWAGVTRVFGHWMPRRLIRNSGLRSLSFHFLVEGSSWLLQGAGGSFGSGGGDASGKRWFWMSCAQRQRSLFPLVMSGGCTVICSVVRLVRRIIRTAWQIAQQTV